MTILVLTALIISYLLGSIPMAVWLSKYIYGQDIREIGSGNAGSTNMYRTYGFKAGFLTQIFDISKSFLSTYLPIILSKYLGTESNDFSDFEFLLLRFACGLFSILGHTYPIFAQFKGGKGVNSILGMMLALHPVGCLVGLATFLSSLIIFQMVSLSSILAISIFPLVVLGQMIYYKSSEPGQLLFLGVGIALAIWVFYTHRENIKRIQQGNERKVDLLSKLKVKS